MMEINTKVPASVESKRVGGLDDERSGDVGSTISSDNIGSQVIRSSTAGCRQSAHAQ